MLYGGFLFHSCCWAHWFNFTQKSVHHLCNQYFDMSRSFNFNYSTCPAEYGLIVEKVCLICAHLQAIYLSLVADNGQMKELHPWFRFHMGDWVTCHFAVTHCQVMSRSFTRLGDDPDIKIYEWFMNQQRRNQQNETQKALKRCCFALPKGLGLPGLMVSPPVPCFQ